MSSGGHNVKSEKEHKAKGNYRPNRHANRMEGVVKLVATPPKPPSDFDQIHSELWVKTCALLYSHKLLTENDYDIIRLYCETIALRRTALINVAEKGLTYQTDTGHIRQNPNAALILQLTNTLLSITDRFGFNPKSRQALKVGGDHEPEDPLAAFLNN